MAKQDLVIPVSIVYTVYRNSISILFSEHVVLSWKLNGIFIDRE